MLVHLCSVGFHADKSSALPSAHSQLGPLLNRFICYKAMQKDGKEEHGGKKIDSRLCIDHLMYSRDKRGYQRGWFWGNEETRGLNTSGLSVQGSASIVAPILLKNSSAHFCDSCLQGIISYPLDLAVEEMLNHQLFHILHHVSFYHAPLRSISPFSVSLQTRREKLGLPLLFCLLIKRPLVAVCSGNCITES
uniref:GDP-fucose protein O-fucosyltransferase 2-like n=1 Tax=Cyanistes caeruleus TaxID=156563 RepID=A0A8C0UEE2_CYACU